MIFNSKQIVIVISPFLLFAANAFAQADSDESLDKSDVLKGGIASEGTVKEPEDPFTIRLRNRKTPLPPLPKLDPKRSNDPKYVAEMWWEHLGYGSKEEAEDHLQLQKQGFEAAGSKWTPPHPGNPDFVEEYFTIPPSEQLSGCNYVKGYSYPDVCFLGSTKIFDSEVDGQAKLDLIVSAQGKWGKYNKLPKKRPKPTVSETFYIKD